LPREIGIDRDLCMGSAQCSLYAPRTFGQDQTTIAVVIDPNGDPAEAIRLAADSCPTGAITFIEGHSDPDPQHEPVIAGQ
jgi:ferredoxin